MATSEEHYDLDVFLSGIESKLRAPFSSLEISKAISSSPSPTEYLKTVGKVFSRMDKVVQLRFLVGLTGVEHRSNDIDTAMYDLLTQAQDKVLFEEWTRVAAGLVQGFLFSNEKGERNVGKEATQVLIKACGGAHAKKLLQQEAKDDGKEFDETKFKGILDQVLGGHNSIGAIDMNPLFAPYYYYFVGPETLQRILPECMSNPHFSVNEDADILKEDERREREEQAAVAPVSTSRTAEEAAPSALPPVIMPGRKSTAAKPKARSAPKSSMFLPSRKPTAMVAGRMGNARKPIQHTRKAGAAQKLLGKSRQLGQKSSAASGSSGGVSASTGGRSMKFGNARSKMKMIDVSEVSELNKERKERETKQTREQKMTAKKRKIMEAAAAKGLVGAKRSKPNGAEPSPAQASTVQASGPSNVMPSRPGHLEQAAAAALLQYQHDQNGAQPGNAMLPQQAPPAAPAPSDRMALAPGNREELDLLLEKSNKLTDENRIRVRQFWIDRFNPTPELPVVRMKLHEEKSVDPESGMTVKNTDYLELDYNTFGYKKLRKTKKK